MAHDDLFEFHTEAVARFTAIQPSPVLVHALLGFVDAGSSSALAAAHLREHMSQEPLVTFDADLLIDYRARRPRMRFASDRFESVDMPTVSIDHLTDEVGQSFLLLSGMEPDVQWARFTTAVVGLCQQLGVRLAVGMHAIPWNAPHTRPVGLTPHATDRSLIAGRPRWVEDLDVPGSADSLLEFRLGEVGIAACGFAAHVPHYLTNTDYPPASVALLEAIAETSGLEWTLDELKETGAEVLAEVDKQVSDAEESSEAVEALEEQYDAQSRGESVAGMPSPHLPDDELVGEDKLVSDFEAYLRDLGNEPGSK